MTILCIFKEEDMSQSNELSRLLSGSHIVGRDAPIKRIDKRISRKHAIIIVHRNGVIIKSAHANPTFFKSSVGDAVQILRENDTLALNDGDRFALVEDDIWFKIKIIYENAEFEIADDVSFNAICTKRVHEVENTEINKRIKIEPETSPDLNSNTNIDNLIDMPIGQNGNTDTKPNLNEHLSHSTNNNAKRCNQDETHPCNSNRTLNIPQGANIQNVYSANDLQNTNIQVHSNVDTNRVDLNECLPNNSSNHTERCDLDETHPYSPNRTLVIPQPANGQHIHSTNNLPNSDNIKTEPPLDNKLNVGILPISNSNTTNSGVKIKVETNIKEELPVDAENNPNKPSSSTNNNPAVNQNLRRDKCWYAKQCYRKNPAHKNSFSHPGDTDYDNDANDSRPFCPFGIYCYRRNTSHRRQYRHLGVPAPRPVNIQVNVNNCPCHNPHNPNRKPDYDSDSDD